MEKTKKILMITSLSTLAISCILLILAVFGVSVFKGVLLRVLLISSTLAISCGISINEISVIKRKKILGYVGLGLLGLSVIMALVIFCSNLLTNGGIFGKITIIVSISSILFIVIISIYSKLEKSMIGLQVPTYIALILLDIFLSLLIAEVNLFAIKGMLEAFIVLCIVCVGLLIASSVIASKQKNSVETIKNRPDMVTIPKLEYESLRKENEELRKQLEELKTK